MICPASCFQAPILFHPPINWRNSLCTKLIRIMCTVLQSSTLDYLEAAGMLRDMVVGYLLLLDYSLPPLLMLLGCCGQGMVTHRVRDLNRFL